MNSTPTLQSLAVEARDAFGEDGTPRSSPTSFDVVAEVYVQEGNHDTQEGVDSCACAALTNALADSREVTVERRHAVQPFVSMALHFLRMQYPDCDEVKADQRLLSTLFWGHLVEARYAGARSG